MSSFVFFNKLTLLQLSHSRGVSIAATPPPPLLLLSLHLWGGGGGTLRPDRRIRTRRGIFESNEVENELNERKWLHNQESRTCGNICDCQTIQWTGDFEKKWFSFLGVLNQWAIND